MDEEKKKEKKEKKEEKQEGKRAEGEGEQEEELEEGNKKNILPERTEKLMELAKLLPHCSIKEYKIKEVLGQGCNGIVFLAEVNVRGVCDVVALKMILNLGLSTNTLRNEYENEFVMLDSVLNDINKNVMFMIGQFISQPTDEMICYASPTVQDILKTQNRLTGVISNRTTQFFVLEYHPTNLEKHLKQLGGGISVERVMKYAKQVLECFSYLYEKRVVHRDVKLDNILVSEEDDIVLSDFGESLLVESDFTILTSQLKAGNARFTAPEIHNQMKLRNTRIDFSGQYSWEVGCLLYEISFGRFPFPGYPGLSSRVPYQVPPATLENHLPGLPPAFVEMIGNMLHYDPNLRLPWQSAVSIFNSLIN